MSGPYLSIVSTATIVAMIIMMPPRPRRGMLATIISNQAVDNLLMSVGTFLNTGPASLVANTKVVMQFVGGPAATSWAWIK